MTTSRGIPLPDVPGVRGISETGQVQFEPPPEAPPVAAPAPAEKETPLSKRVRRQFEESKIFTRKEIKQAGLEETPKTWEVEGYQRWYYDSPEGRQIILQDIARSRASRGLPIDWEKIPDGYVPDLTLKKRKRIKGLKGGMGITAGEYERITGAAPVAGRPPKPKIQPAKPTPVKPAWQQEIEDWGRRWVDQAKTKREQKELEGEVKTFSDKIIILNSLDVTPKTRNEPTEKVKSTIWGYLTPWRETEGETVGSWFKNKFVSPKVESQQVLQSEFIKGEDQPLWARLLFGQDVVYDEGRNEYARLIKGYGPAAGGKLPVKTMQRLDWGAITRLAKPPNADWRKALDLIKTGKITTPKQAATWVNNQPVFTQGTPAAWLRAAQTVYTMPTAQTVLKMAPVTTYSKQRLFSVLTPMLRMPPDNSLRAMQDAGLLLPAIAIHPARVIENINTASPDVRDSALVQLSPQLQEVIATGDEVQARVMAVQDAQVQSYVAAMNEQIVGTEARLANEGATDTQIQQVVDNMVQTNTETITDPVTRFEVQTQVQTAMQTATQPETWTPTRTRIVTPTQVGPAPRVPVLQPSIIQPRIVTPEKVKVPPKPKWPYKVDRPITSRRIPDGSIAWRNGFNWRFIPPPYNQLKPISLGNVAPIGAKDGGRAVVDTLQIIGRARSKVPRRVAIDLGFVDIVIMNGRRIVFTGGGQGTDIGVRDPSPTMGMSVINGGIDRPAFRGVAPLERGDRVEIRELRGEEERMLRPGIEQEYEPEETEAYEPREPAPKPEPSDVDDLFSVTHEDIQGKHDGNSTDDGDYSEITMLTDEDEGDVIEVTDGDIYGEAPTTRRSVRRFQRTQRSYQPPPSSLGGMRV